MIPEDKAKCRKCGLMMEYGSRAAHEKICRGTELANRTCAYCNNVYPDIRVMRCHEKKCPDAGEMRGAVTAGAGTGRGGRGRGRGRIGAAAKAKTKAKAKVEAKRKKREIVRAQAKAKLTHGAKGGKGGSKGGKSRKGIQKRPAGTR